MRVIDADAIPYITPLRETIAYKEDIDKMPTIDAVEVVRCKDCKHCHYEQEDDIYHCHKLFHRFYDTEHYCSYGERKTDHE